MEELERLQPGRSPLADPDFWNRRARRFATTGPLRSAERDPFVPLLRRMVTPSSTLLDVGSGPGRFTLALAPRVQSAVALDPSKRMLTILRRRAKEAGLTNVRTVVGGWPEAADRVGSADVVVCAHVLPLIPDAKAFLGRLDTAARGRVLVYMGTFASDSVVDPLWRHFHGGPRKPPPTYLDAVAVLDELGIEPHVKVVEAPVRARHVDLDAAVKNYMDTLALPDRTSVRRELAGLLSAWLQPTGDGAFRPPLRSQANAVLSWTPKSVEGV
jgi:SAM-dependent methyltransferase